jgi:hypothetical protein
MKPGTFTWSSGISPRQLLTHGAERFVRVSILGSVTRKLSHDVWAHFPTISERQGSAITIYILNGGFNRNRLADSRTNS